MLSKNELKRAAKKLRINAVDHDVILGRAVVILSAREADELGASVLRLIKMAKASLDE